MNHTFDSNGVRLGYRDTGSGLPVVFLHPTPLNRDYWRPLIEDLAGVRAIVPDFRGHGLSELGENLPTCLFDRAPHAGVLTMAQLAKDTVSLLDHLNIPDAIFAGCSIGGYGMLELWRQAPQRMSALAFVCSKPQPDAEANRVKRAAIIAQIQDDGVAPLFDGFAHSLLGASAIARRPQIVSEVRAQMTLTPQAAIAVQAGLAVRPDSLGTVATIDVPILAICGGEDPGVTPAEMQSFHAAPGGCEFHLLPDAGHFAAYEQPHKVAALLAEWLRQPQP